MQAVQLLQELIKDQRSAIAATEGFEKMMSLNDRVSKILRMERGETDVEILLNQLFDLIALYEELPKYPQTDYIILLLSLNIISRRIMECNFDCMVRLDDYFKHTSLKYFVIYGARILKATKDIEKYIKEYSVLSNGDISYEIDASFNDEVSGFYKQAVDSAMSNIYLETVDLKIEMSTHKASEKSRDPLIEAFNNMMHNFHQSLQALPRILGFSTDKGPEQLYKEVGFMKGRRSSVC